MRRRAAGSPACRRSDEGPPQRKQEDHGGRSWYEQMPPDIELVAELGAEGADDREVSASFCSADGSGLSFFLVTASSVASVSPLPPSRQAQRDRTGNTVRSTDLWMFGPARAWVRPGGISGHARQFSPC
jgi:hypothetical protein